MQENYTHWILFTEVIKVFWWFNPVIYFYKNSLQEAHEYEVDQAVCRQYDRKDYAALLLRLGTTLSLAPANMFSLHPLKDRVKMLFNNRSNQSRRWIYLLMLPLVLIACEQLGTHKQAGNGKTEDLLTIGSDSTTLIIDSTTTLQNIRRAARKLKEKKDIDLAVSQYEANPAGKIVLIQLKVKNKTTGGAAAWDLRTGHKDFWKNYRIIVAETRAGGSQLYVHSVPRNNRDVTLSPMAMQSIRHGKALFQSNCAACHNPVKDMTGPALAGVTDHRPTAWIYAFVRNSSALMARGDTSAIRIFDQWHQVPMTRFPELSDKDIDDIFSYVNTYPQTGKHFVVIPHETSAK